VTPVHFIRKWAAAGLSERSAAQQHFLDLCALLGEPTPVEADPDGDTAGAGVSLGPGQCGEGRGLGCIG